jgi:hypothetical protein
MRRLVFSFVLHVIAFFLAFIAMIYLALKGSWVSLLLLYFFGIEILAVITYARKIDDHHLCNSNKVGGN